MECHAIGVLTCDAEGRGYACRIGVRVLAVRNSNGEV